MWIDDVTAFVFALAPARVAAWPALAGVGATVATAVRDGRRRTVLNEHVHELRRPLQALALMSAADGAEPGEGPVEMAAAALSRLEREINGEREDASRAIVAVRPLLESARRRWSARAALSGAELALRRDAAEAAVEGDRIALAAALDNLIANALEHGGERIELAADRLGDRVCVAVVDSGRAARRPARGREAWRRASRPRRKRGRRSPLARLSGRARHGHGLRLVHRTAAAHGGSFALLPGERGTSAVLELPLLSPRRGSDGNGAGRAAPPARRRPGR